MRVKLDSVTVSDEKIIVDFSTTFGAATATWKAPLPIIGEEYDVELDIDDDFVWGENASYECNEHHLLKIEKNWFSISGILISSSIDGTAVINVAGSIVIIFLDGYIGAIPIHVTLKATELSITPTGV